MRPGLKRSPVRKKRPGKARRGRVVDREYLAWLGEQRCCVTGKRPITLHHVRRCGEQKNDHRAIPLVAELHLMTVDSENSIEALGKKKFEARFGVDLELLIRLFQTAYIDSSDSRRESFIRAEVNANS